MYICTKIASRGFMNLTAQLALGWSRSAPSVLGPRTGSHKNTYSILAVHFRGLRVTLLAWLYKGAARQLLLGGGLQLMSTPSYGILSAQSTASFAALPLTFAHFSLEHGYMLRLGRDEWHALGRIGLYDTLSLASSQYEPLVLELALQHASSLVASLQALHGSAEPG